MQPQWLPVWTGKRSALVVNPGWQAEAKQELWIYLWVFTSPAYLLLLSSFPLSLLSLLHSLCLSPSLLVPPSPVSCFTSEWGADVSRDMCISDRLSYLLSSSVPWRVQFQKQTATFPVQLSVCGTRVEIKEYIYLS